MLEEFDDTDDKDPYLDGFLETAFLAANSEDGAELFEGRPDPTAIPPTHPNYEVLGRIGRGAVGDVYRVRDRNLGRSLALKVLRPAHLANPELAARLREEAQLCSQLTHPGIVPVHETGTLDDGRPYFTMKLVDGRDFAEILGTQDPAPRHLELLEILRKVCQTIAFAHSEGIVHGDIKPQNVMVGAFGEVQVMDWGFALRTGDASGNEPPKSRAGTPAYMAPEQAHSGGRIDERSDVYGLGAILFEILAGRPPHDGASRRDRKLERPDPLPLREVLALTDAEQDLIELCLRALSENPADRPQNGKEMHRELQSFLEGTAERAREMELRAATAQASLASSRRARRFALLAFSSILAAVLVIATMLLLASQERGRELATLSQQIAEARSLAETKRALATRDHDARHWDEAVAAAERALALARSPAGNETLVAGARGLVEEIRRGRDRAAKIAALVVQLEPLVPHLGDDRSAGELEPKFTAAFAGVGVVDGGSRVSEASLKLARDLDDPEILHGLDSWLLLRHKYHLPDATAWRVPFGIAQSIDGDDTRRAIRTAFVDGDRERMLDLSRPERLVQMAPPTLEFLGRCLYEHGADDEARRVFERAHELHPGNARISHNLAILLNVKDPEQRERARRLLSMALAARPEDEHLHTDLAMNRVEADDMVAARHWAQRGISFEEDSGRAWFVLGHARAQLDDFGGAQKALRRALSLGFRAARERLIVLYFATNRYREAVPLIEEMRSQQPTDRSARLLEALAHGELGRHDLALRLFDALIERWPGWARAHGHRALLLATMARMDEAELAMQRCRAGESSDDVVKQLLPSWTASLETRRAAYRMARPFLARDEVPQGLEALAYAQWLALAKGEYEYAARVFEALEKLAPELPIGLVMDGIRSYSRMAVRAPGGSDARQQLEAKLRRTLEAELAAILTVCAAQPERADGVRLHLQRLHAEPALGRLDTESGHADRGYRARIADTLDAIDV